MRIKIFGKGERLEVAAEILRKNRSLGKYSEIVILPIPTSRDGACITGTDLGLSAALSPFGQGSFLLGYGIPRGCIEELEDRGAVVCDALGDETFLSQNAELTALGTLGVILTSSKKSVSELKIGIIGYGRIGKQLLRLLLFLGAGVKVFTRKNSTRVDLCSYGIDAEMSSEGDYTGLDFLINTAPEQILDERSVMGAIADGRIIELASGDNFPDTAGITRLGGIPGLMYPISAGRIYAEAAARYEGGEGSC